MDIENPINRWINLDEFYTEIEMTLETEIGYRKRARVSHVQKQLSKKNMKNTYNFDVQTDLQTFQTCLCLDFRIN